MQVQLSNVALTVHMPGGNSELHGAYAGGAAAEEGQAPGPTGASAMASPPSRCPSDALLSREDFGKEVKPHKGAE